MRILLDCDPGHDDAFAIMLAARTAELVGVTTVSGNAPLANVTRNALAILHLLGSDAPVHAGAERPLACEPMHAPHVHGSAGLGAVPLPEHDRVVASEDAVSYLLAQSSSESDLWLVAVGPLTNVALAIQQDPDFAHRLAGISIMGGSTNGGNCTAAAEFNIFADPEAAAIVLGSGARIRMCGLNLTAQLRSDASWIDRLQNKGTTLGRFSAGLLGDVHQRLFEYNGWTGAPLHDPCAVMAVTHPEWFEFHDRAVDVECTGEHTRGMTVVDERPRSRETNVEVAYVIDAERAAPWLLTHAC